MSKVDDATTADGSGDWFKVAQDTYNGTTEGWGTEILNANCGKRTFTGMALCLNKISRQDTDCAGLQSLPPLRLVTIWSAPKPLLCTLLVPKAVSHEPPEREKSRLNPVNRGLVQSLVARSTAPLCPPFRDA